MYGSRSIIHGLAGTCSPPLRRQRGTNEATLHVQDKELSEGQGIRRSRQQIITPCLGSRESLQLTLTHPFQTCSRVPHANLRTLNSTQSLSH